MSGMGNDHSAADDRSLFAAAIRDGRPLVIFTGLCLLLAGCFVLFQSATGHFLPHDSAYLGMSAEELCSQNECRIVHFMIHDRVSFGGTMIAIGALYMWLAEFPLRRGEAWAWWLLVASGLVGFGSFLAYLGYGYLDTWHGVATLVLLPFFVWGVIRSRALVRPPASIRALLAPALPLSLRTPLDVGRLALLATAAGITCAGATIMIVGMTSVFVPQDLAFMGLTKADLQALNPRLVPLIAHDRAGFGGGLCSTGVTVFFCVWCARPSKSLWQVLALAGTVGFACAILVHPAIGYTDFFHLAPAYLGAVSYAMGMILSYRGMMRGDKEATASATG